jgi:AraC family transcriptional regulator
MSGAAALAQATPISNRWVSSLRKSRYAPSSRLARHHHDEPVLCLVLSGRYIEKTRGLRREHGSGDLLYCPAFEEHAQTFLPQGAVKLLMKPTLAALEWLEGARVDQAPFARCARLRAIGAQLVAELARPDSCSVLIIEGLAGELVGLLGRASAGESATAEAKIRAVLALVKEPACAPLTLASIAEAVGADPARLSADFRRSVGTTIGEYARRSRLERAVDRLSNSRVPLAQLAAECGFYDQAHFTRAFSAAYGTTPARFRASVQ